MNSIIRCLVVVLPLFSQSAHAQIERASEVRENRAFIYHGKIVRPDGSTPDGSVAVNLKIYSPDPSLCLLWSETQTVSLKSGAFALELGHNVNRLTGASGGAAANFKKVFLNNPSAVVSSAQCATGSSYTPGVADDRLMSASFNDNGNVIELAGLPIKSVPFALQAEEIGGFGLANLMKIDGSSNVTYTAGEVQSLKDMLGGEIAWDMKSRKITNVGAPTLANDAATMGWVQAQLASVAVTSGAVTTALGYTPLNKAGDTMTGVLGLASIASDPAGLGVSDKGKVWFNNTSGEIKYWTGASAVAVGISGGGLTSVGLSAPSMFDVTNSPLTSNGTISMALASQSANRVLASPDGSSGVPTFRALASTDIPSIDTGKLTSGILGVARGGTGLSPAVADANKVYGINSAGTSPEFKTITQGSGVTVTHGAGTITIAATGSGGTVTNVSGTAPVSVSNGSTSPTISMLPSSNSVDGYLTAADHTAFAAKLSVVAGHTLAQNKVWLGNASNQAAADFFGLAQLRNSLGTVQFPAACTTAQTLRYNSVTDILDCVDINSLNADKITAGTLNTARLGSGTADSTKYLRGDGSWQTLPAAGAGTVTNVTSANADIGVTNGSTTPSLTLNSGTTGGAGDANKIAKLDSGGLLTAAMLPNHSAAKITSGTLAIAQGGTNSGTTLNNNRIMVSSGSAIVESAAITANRALASSASGIPVATAVTDTELGYLSGVTSSVQTQISGKQASLGYTPVNKAGDTMTGALNLASNGLAVGTSQLVVSGGNVGVGTTSPGSKLHVSTSSGDVKVSGASPAYGVLIDMPAAVGSWAREYSFGHDGTKMSSVGMLGTNGTGTYLYLNASQGGATTGHTSPSMVILPSGNVGVGTTGPTETLSVVGKILSSSVTTDATIKQGYYGVGHYTNAEEPFIGVRMSSSSGSNVLDLGGGTAQGNAATVLLFTTGASNTTTTGTERMRIDNNGNVGIGTTSPAAKLDVGGEVKFGNSASACNATREGQQRYNSTSKVMEFCNGTAWTEFGSGGGGSQVIYSQVFTSGTSWTSPAGITASTVFKITMVGGGGGGGGGYGTASKGYAPGAGGAGGSGGMAIRYISGLTASTAYTIAIGAAGTAGTATPGNGGAGGNTTITIGGTTVTAGGGGGGLAGNNSIGAGGAGGTVTSASFAIPGAPGGSIGSIIDSGTVSGTGGSNTFGRGANGAAPNSAGSAGTGYGSGGSGGIMNSGTTAGRAGGAGRPGFIMIESVF